MGKLHEIALRHEQFEQMMNVHIANSILSQEKKLVDMNRKQMLSSKDVDNKPLIHSKTGKTTLSIGYQKRTGKKKPNLFLSGGFQKAMFINVDENENKWFIGSEDFKTGFLVKNYGKIFGVPVSQRLLAKKLTSKEFKRLYRSLVLAK